MRTDVLVYAALSVAVLWALSRKLAGAAVLPTTLFRSGAPANFPELYTAPEAASFPQLPYTAPEPATYPPMPTAAPAPTLNAGTLAFIRAREGLRLSAYPDAGGYSIGYGHFLGTSPTPANITNAQAESWLQQDAQRAAIAVTRLVTVPLTQNQFDALVSFVYNVGAGAFQNSTLLKLLNAGDYNNAAQEFGKWIYSKGAVVGSLTTRRALEKSLFLA